MQPGMSVAVLLRGAGLVASATSERRNRRKLCDHADTALAVEG
jgi:hypothetical protein